LIYQVPVLDALQQDKNVKALFIFPTKALEQDQKKSFVDLLSGIGPLSHIIARTFDGDTAQVDRAPIRENASGTIYPPL